MMTLVYFSALYQQSIVMCKPACAPPSGYYRQAASSSVMLALRPRCARCPAAIAMSRAWYKLHAERMQEGMLHIRIKEQVIIGGGAAHPAEPCFGADILKAGRWKNGIGFRNASLQLQGCISWRQGGAGPNRWLGEGLRPWQPGAWEVRRRRRGGSRLRWAAYQGSASKPEDAGVLLLALHTMGGRWEVGRDTCQLASPSMHACACASCAWAQAAYVIWGSACLPLHG